MNSCSKCGKVYAEQFDNCPHCLGKNHKVLGCFVLAAIGLAASVTFWASVGGENVPSVRQAQRSVANGVLGSLPTGSNDPYSSGQKALGNIEYEQSKNDLLRKVQMAASAARCRVISDVESQVIDRRGIQAISDADINAGRSDYHPDLLPAVQAAAAKAYEDAGQRGGCDFWQQNPEAVAQMRRLAYLATTGP